MPKPVKALQCGATATDPDGTVRLTACPPELPEEVGPPAAGFFPGGPFSRLPIGTQASLRAAMVTRDLAAGEILFRQGDSADGLYVVERGEVTVTAHGQDGATVELGKSGAGDVLGEMALVCGGTRTATVMATVDTRLLALPVDAFESLCLGRPAVAQLLTEVVADRLGRGRQDALFAKSLEGYDIAARLGRGGMAVVYDATHTASGRRVALKMMSHRLVFDPASREMFDREGDLVASFAHSNIPKVLDRFAAFRTRFLAIEFVDGATLADLISPGRGLPVGVGVAVLGQIADALAYAHAAGVVHRDLKPSNLMLDTGGAIKLLDFGIALPRCDGGPPAGTPGYVAPEQFHGGAVGPEADYFSLGCIAFELVTGRRAFPDTDFADCLKRSTLDLRSFRDLLPEADETLASLFDSALRRDPRERRVDLARLRGYAARVAHAPDHVMRCSNRGD